MKQNNTINISDLSNSLISHGFELSPKGTLQKQNLELKIVNQRFDGIELWIVKDFGNVRIDFLLEYYLSEKLSLSKRLFEKAISSTEYYTLFLNQFKSKLEMQGSILHDYQEWLKNPKPNIDDIRELLIG